MEFLWITIGLAVGIVVSTIIYRVCSTGGVLKVDHSDPGKDVYRFEVKNIDVISKKKWLILKIDNKADLSQK